MGEHRSGARQLEPFDPRKAARLDDPARFAYLPPAQVFDILDAPQGGLVVDFGAGTGAYALRLAHARPDLGVVAFDSQPRMLDILKKKLVAEPVPNLRLVLAGSEEARSLIVSADRVLGINVLHELDDDSVRQAAAFLKPAGKGLFIDWNSRTDRPSGPPKEEVYSPDEASARLKGLGLKVLNARLFLYHYALIWAPH